jgi:predicted ATP-grasp superfamily ATP-dependent carboligase
MASKLKVFVCEFITGGGLYNAPLPPSLAREGDAMLGALLADLLQLPEVEVATTRDPRLSAPALPVRVETAQENIWELWERCIADADAIWPIAPETGGVLERISTMADSKSLLGCTPSAIRIAASKRATALHLEKAGIAVVPTWLPSEFAPRPGRFVAKPDDGVGCEDTKVFDSADALRLWITQRSATHVIQPWLAGEAASLSMICRNGRAQLLSCNRQLIELTDGTIHYRGSLLNGFAQHWSVFERLAQQVASAMPELAGYVGVDVMVDQSGLTVLEINPRLTTSYAGLHQATGLNPAGLVLDLLYNGRMIEPNKIQRNLVQVDMVRVNVDD